MSNIPSSVGPTTSILPEDDLSTTINKFFMSRPSSFITPTKSILPEDSSKLSPRHSALAEVIRDKSEELVLSFAKKNNFTLDSNNEIGDKEKLKLYFRGNQKHLRLKNISKSFAVSGLSVMSVKDLSYGNLVAKKDIIKIGKKEYFVLMGNRVISRQSFKSFLEQIYLLAEQNKNTILPNSTEEERAKEIARKLAVSKEAVTSQQKRGFLSGFTPYNPRKNPNDRNLSLNNIFYVVNESGQLQLGKKTTQQNKIMTHEEMVKINTDKKQNYHVKASRFKEMKYKITKLISNTSIEDSDNLPQKKQPTATTFTTFQPQLGEFQSAQVDNQLLQFPAFNTFYQTSLPDQSQYQPTQPNNPSWQYNNPYYNSMQSNQQPAGSSLHGQGENNEFNQYFGHQSQLMHQPANNSQDTNYQPMQPNNPYFQYGNPEYNYNNGQTNQQIPAPSFRIQNANHRITAPSFYIPDANYQQTTNNNTSLFSSNQVAIPANQSNQQAYCQRNSQQNGSRQM